VASQPLQDGPPVDHDQRQRRFQFSLRKLLLWMAVLAVYLGVLRLITAPVSFTLITISWLAVIVAVRMKWGARRACFVAIAGTGFCLSVASAAMYWIDFGPFHGDKFGRRMTGYMPLMFLVGAFIGLHVLIVVELSIGFVDFLDRLTQTKTPHDDDGENNS
jgi:hypothetical protein